METLACSHPRPELCRLLGRHIAGGLWKRWNENPQYREKWANQAGLDVSFLEEQFPPTQQSEVTQTPQKKITKKPTKKQMPRERELGSVPGVGSNLKRILEKKYKLRSSASCDCNRRAKEMDKKGIEWCERNKEILVKWLCEGAAERMWLKPIVSLFGGIVEKKALELIEDAIEMTKNQTVEPIENHTDPLIVTDKNKQRTNIFRDCAKVGNSRCVGFLVCGGPSAKELDLSLLEQRGIWSMAVNNMAGYFKPNCFVCSDPPSKFSDGIWLDPGVMKFVPVPKLIKKRGRLRRKVGEAFQSLEINGEHLSACDCPNTWGFERRAWFQPDETFFTDESASWGNHNAGCNRTGLEKTVCTMLLGIRLLFYMGVRTLYLCGVDLHMNPNADLLNNYAFPEERDRGAIQSNNEQYRIVNKWLCEMQESGIFARFGMEIYNCNENSALEAFPHVPYNLALQDALKYYPQTDEYNRLDCKGFYKK